MLYANMQFFKLYIIILYKAALLAQLKDSQNWGKEGLKLKLNALIVYILILRNKLVSFLKDINTAVLEIINKIKLIIIKVYILNYNLALQALRLPVIGPRKGL